MQFIACDTETREFIKGVMMTPPIVCSSYADGTGAHIIIGADETVDKFATLLADDDVCMVFANAAYDFGVVAAAAPDLLPAIFAKYDKGLVFDVLIAADLALIADGLLGLDPRSGLTSVAVDEESDETQPARRMSLDLACELFLNKTNAKENDYWRRRYGILEFVPFDLWPADARQYPLDDANNTLAVAMEQMHRSRQGTLQNLHDQEAQARAAWGVHLTCLRGWRTDKAEVDRIEKAAAEAFTKARATFKEFGYLKDNDKQNTAAVKRAVAIAYGVDPASVCRLCSGTGRVPSTKRKSTVVCKAGIGGCDATGLDLTETCAPRTPTGNLSAGRDTLKESGDDSLMAYGSVSEIKKIQQTYVPWLRKGQDVPMLPSIRSLGAATGRTTAGHEHTLPRGFNIRNAIKPRPGNVYSSVDYGALELVTLAQSQYNLFGRSALRDALNLGFDPHAALAAVMMGVEYDHFMAELAAGNKLYKEYRSAAKNCNFGFPGGMGVPKFLVLARKVGMRFCKAIGGAERCGVEKVTQWKHRQIPPTCKKCLEIGKVLREQWLAMWKEQGPYFDHITAQVDTHGQITQFVSERIRGGLDFCSGSNTYFQGLAADGAKAALYAVVKECFTDCNSPLWGSRPVLFFHDEIITEHPEATAGAAAVRISEIMVAVMKQYTPDVRVAAPPALMRAWDKAAEPTYNAAGVLVPFTDADATHDAAGQLLPVKKKS